MSSRCASSVPRAPTPAPAAIQIPSCAWFASSGPVSFSNVWMPSSPPTVATERQSRSPKIDDQVGRNPFDLLVELLRLVDLRRERRAVLVGDRREPRGRSSRTARSRRRHRSLRARGPRRSGRRARSSRRRPTRSSATSRCPTFSGRQTPSGSASSASRPSRRSHSLMRMPPSSRFAPWSETTSTGVSSSACASRPPIRPSSGGSSRGSPARKRLPGSCLRCCGVHELPEAVVDAVGAHLDHREELPRLRLEQVLGEREALVGHLVDLRSRVVLVVAAEAGRSRTGTRRPSPDLVAQAGRERVLALEAGVRKQLTIAPRSGFGGYVPGTPRTIDGPPARPTRSHSRGALDPRRVGDERARRRCGRRGCGSRRRRGRPACGSTSCTTTPER